MIGHGVPEGESPLLSGKEFRAEPVFTPENLLREGRRQRGVADGKVPRVCLLDPDGDIVRHLCARSFATPCRHWACYHTTLHEFAIAGGVCGVIGCAVGGPFAVLVAEELFASGCELVVSITSAGQILPVRQPPYFILIDRALRDEGTSHHYLPPAPCANLGPALRSFCDIALRSSGLQVESGATWTTDAPFRETETAISAARERGILAVEMEAASLYAMAEARGRPVVCFAHITNHMGVEAGDFEKGEADGSGESLRLFGALVAAWSKVGVLSNSSLPT
jgi:uridine phosphorylase